MASADNFGMTQIQSFDAVQAWISNINSNLGGAGRTGYKTQRVDFGGSNAFVMSTVSRALGPMQLAEVSMTVTQSAGDFSQGQVRVSSSDTHFAIKDRPTVMGSNFFVVRDPLDYKGVSSDGVPGNHTYYLTRDGEYHWTAASRNANGNGNHEVAVPPDPSGNGTQGFVLVNNYGLFVVNQNGRPLFETTPAFPAANNASDKPIIVNVKKPQNLIYSRFGASIYANDYGLINPNDTPNGSLPLADFTSGKLDVSQDRPPADKFYLADRNQSALEASNSSVTLLIPELTLAQKTFTALAKTLTVSTENMDTVFGFIR